MKKIILLLLLTGPSLAFGADFLEKIESNVYEAKGSKQDLAKKAQKCIVNTVSNDEVRISDSAGGTLPIPGEFKNDGIAGGALFTLVDIEGGMVVASNRVDYRANLLSHSAKSTLTVLTKDDRFKVSHTNIEYLQKNTGFMQNNGYSKIWKGWGTGWKDAEKALEGITENIAACIHSDEKEW